VSEISSMPASFPTGGVPQKRLTAAVLGEEVCESPRTSQPCSIRMK
jgi:hypothetical protein